MVDDDDDDEFKGVRCLLHLHRYLPNPCTDSGATHHLDPHQLGNYAA